MTALSKIGETQMANVEIFGDALIDEFIKSRYASKNTSRTYCNALNQLLKYFAVRKIAAPTTADVDAFICELRAAKKSDSTIRLYYTVTRLYFSFLGKRGKYSDVAADCAPLKIAKATTHKKASLTDEQAQKLLHAVKGDSLVAFRNRAIIALCLQCGLRTCEISRANVGDLQVACGYWLLAVQGKGHQTADAKVKVAEPVAEMILSYLEKRGNCSDDDPLFASASNNANWAANSYGKRLSEQSVGKMIRTAMISAGIVKIAKDKNGEKKRSPISAHSTRHYAATTAIKSGVDMREVSEMLRHTSIVVTAVYLHDITLETRRAELAVASKLFNSALKE